MQTTLFGAPAATNGFRDSSFSKNKNLPLHRWVPWIAGFSADFVEDAIRSSPAKELGLLGIRPVRRGRNYAGRIVSYWAERGRLRDQSLRLTRHKNQIERDEN